MFTIIGGGFGLYGYLPAMLRTGWNDAAALPEKYRATVEGRPELAPFAAQIEWRPTVADCLRGADGVVVAVPPFAQRAFIRQALDAGVKDLIIEKPVAPLPDEADELLNSLASVRYRVGYLFLYTDWFRALSAQVALRPRRFRLDWSFKADHFAKNKDVWKRYHSKGGGPLRFYGIHVIAALAKLGYTTVESSRLDDATWSARFHGHDLPPFELSIDSNSDQQIFLIDADWTNTSTAIIQAPSPFVEQRTDRLDQRVQLLEAVATSFREPDDEWLATYRATNDLWRRVEG